MMRPPFCDICGKRFDPDREGALIYFKQTAAGREFDRRVREENVTGHPPDAEWFCGTHSKEADKLKHMTVDEAREILKKRFGPAP